MSDVHSAEIGALRAVDLNLLVAFDALLRERSVTRAARRMGVTQSAMSHTLRRLRELLDDPLLIRGKRGMVATPRAEQLMVPLRGSLVGLARSLAEPPPFDPQRSKRRFRLVGPDLFDVLALPALLQALHERAPRVDLAVLPAPGASMADRLETGELDLAVVPVLDDVAEDVESILGELRQRTLFRDQLGCYFRADHPRLAEREDIDLDLYCELPHLLISPGGEGPGLIDDALEERGLSRRIALRLPTFASAPAITAQSDLVLTAPSSLAAVLNVGETLRSLPCPLPVGGHAVTIVWHPRFTEDQGHRWLRELLVEVTQSLPLRGARSRKVTAEA